MPIKQQGNIKPPSPLDVAKFKKELPLLIANMAVNHFKQGFRNGGGQTDYSLGGWTKRKKETRLSMGKPILTNRGDLKKDVQKRRDTFDRIEVGTLDVEYGEYHNEGTDTMPKREFIGKSKKLEGKIELKITQEIRKLFK